MTRLTILNVLAGTKQFEAALNIHRAWGITSLDLKNWIFEKSVLTLTDEEAERAAGMIQERGMSVYCLSSELFHDTIELGEEHFRRNHLDALQQLLANAKRLKPKVIRLLAAKTSRRGQIGNSIDYIEDQHPWLIPMYREAVDLIHEAGYETTIENETKDCIFASPDEIIPFFEKLDRRGKVHFTYDVQNLWQMGTFPSLEVYEQLKPWIGYLHLKGGQTGEAGTNLAWSSTLEDASWPVLDMTRQAIKDQICDFICLNNSHGSKKEGYDYEGTVERNISFLRNAFPELDG